MTPAELRDLRGIVLGILRRGQAGVLDFEDLLSEAWMAWHEAERTWKPERSSLRTWQGNRARWAALEAVRCAARRAARDLKGEPLRNRTHHPDAAIDAATLLAQLPPAEAEVLDLVYLRGMKQREAARHLGVSQCWVSKLHERGLLLARVFYRRTA